MNVKRKYLFWSIILFSNIIFINNLPNNKNQIENVNNSNNSQDNQRNKSKEKTIDIINQLIESNNKLNDENHNLNLKKKIYEICKYALLSINVLLFLILLFKICKLNSSNKEKSQIIPDNLNINENMDIDCNKIKENLVINNEKSLSEEDIIQNGIEAPDENKYINTPNSQI